MVVAILFVVALVVMVVARWVVAYLRFRRLELAIPGPPSLFLLGNGLDLLGVHEDHVVERLLGLWGGRWELSRTTIGPLILFIFATDPDDIEKVVRGKETQDKAKIFYPFVNVISNNGLFTANGATWKAHRKLILPAFHRDVLDRYQDVFSDESLKFVSRRKDGVSQNVIADLTLFTMKAFLRTALVNAVSSSGEEEAIFPDLVRLMNVFPPTVTKRAVHPWLWPDALFKLSPTGKSVYALLDKVSAMFRRVIFSRRAQLKQKKAESVDHPKDYLGERQTLLDILLEGTDEGSLTDDEIIEEIKIFFGGAIETSTTTLGWALKVLSLRQDIQDKMVEEAKSVLGRDDTIATHHVERLEYTERFIKETLRLLPSTPILARNVANEFVLNDKTIPKDATMGINVFGAHRHPSHWEEPLKFDPDRFLPERSVGRHRYAYLAFSAGPRNCIGGLYAMKLMKTMFATLVTRYRVDPVDDGHTDPSKFPMGGRITSFMPGGVHVIFSKRDQAAVS